MAAALSSSSNKNQPSQVVLEDQGDGTFRLYSPQRQIVGSEKTCELFEKIKSTQVYLGDLCSKPLFEQKFIDHLSQISDIWERARELRGLVNKASLSYADKPIANVVTKLAQTAIREPMHKDQEGIELLDTLLQMGINPNNQLHNDFFLKANHPLGIIVTQYSLGLTNPKEDPAIQARYREVVACLTRYGSECRFSGERDDFEKLADEVGASITVKKPAATN